MAIQVIEQYLPKTAAYINWVFQNDSKERGGHHNYVAEQTVLNSPSALANQSTQELFATDEALFSKLHQLDNQPDCVLVTNHEEFTDYAEVVDIYGQGCNYPTKKGVDGFQVDFDVIAIKNSDEQGFHIIYQSAERTCNIRAYSGIEMELATIYGCDADESNELTDFMCDDEKTFLQMNAIAKKLCLDWLEANKDNE